MCFKRLIQILSKSSETKESKRFWKKATEGVCYV